MPQSASALHLIPGTMCDERLWHHLLPHLPDFDVSYASFTDADTLEKMIESVAGGIPEGAHLPGFSLGGYLAAEAILRFDLNVRSLTLVATALAGLTADEKTLRRTNAKIIGRSDYRGMSRRRLAQFLHPQNLDKEQVTSVIMAMEKDLGKDVLVKQLLATIERRDLSRLLSNIKTRIHLIAATDDAITDNRPMRKLAQDGLVRLTEIGPPDAISGHMLPLETPHVLARVLKQFYRKP